MGISVGEVTARFTADTKGFTSGVSDAQAQTAAFEAQAATASQATGEFENSLQNVGATSSTTAAKMQATNAAAAKQAAAFNQSSTAMVTATQAAAAANQGQANLAKGAENVNKSFGRSVFGVLSFVSTIVTLVTMAAKINKASTLIGEGMKKLGAHLSQVGESAAPGIWGMLAKGLGKASDASGGFIHNAGGIAGAMGQVGKAVWNTVGTFGKLSAEEGLMGAATTMLGGAFGGLMAAVAPLATMYGAIIAAFSIAKFAFASAAATAAMNQQLNALTATYGKAGASASAWARNVSVGYQLTTAQAAQAATSFGAFFTEAGFSDKAAMALGTSLTELAADMSVFKGIGMDEAINAITSALGGIYRPLRQFGIIMNEGMVIQKAVKMNIAQVGEQLTTQQRQLAVTALITEQYGKAMGFAAKHALDYSVQSRQMSANMGRLHEEMGKLALPFVAFGKIVVNLVLTSLINMAHQITTVIGGIGKLIGVIGKIPGLSQGFHVLRWAIGTLTGANVDAAKTGRDMAAASGFATAEMAKGLPTLDAFAKLIQDGNLAQAESAVQKAAGTKDQEDLTAAWRNGLEALRDQMVAQNRTNAIMETQKKIVEIAGRGWDYYTTELEKIPAHLLSVANAQDAVVQAERGTANALQGRIDADQHIADLQAHQADGAKRVVEAERGVRAAHLAVADAEYQLAKAQQQVNDLAYMQSWNTTAAVNDHNKAIRDVTRAEISYEQAVRAVTRANLDLIQAEVNVEKAGLAVGKAIRDKIRADMALVDAQDALGDAQRKVAADQQNIIDLTKSQVDNQKKLSDAYAGTAGDLTDFASRIKSSFESILDPSKKFNDETGKTADNLQQVIAAQDSYSKAAEVFGVGSAAAEHALNSLNRAQEEAAKKNTDTSHSLTTLTANLQSNLTALKQWRDDLANISAKVGPEAAQMFADLGPEWSGAIHEAAGMSAGALGNVTNLLGQTKSAKSTAAVTGLARSLGDAGISLDYINGLQKDAKTISDDLAGAYRDLNKDTRGITKATLDLQDAEDAVTLAGWAVDEAVRAQTKSQMDLQDAQDAVTLAGLSLRDALEGIDAANRTVAQSGLDLKHITDAEKDAQRGLDQATRGVSDANYALGQALDNVKQAKRDELQWQRDMDAAMRARQSADDTLLQSYKDQGVAAGELAGQTTTVADANFQASIKVDGQIAKLDALAQTLAPNDPLRKRLDDYIARLGGIQTDILTTLGLKMGDSAKQVLAILASPIAMNLTPEQRGQIAFDMLGLAQGGVVTGETVARLAENGPEVVAPLNQLASYLPPSFAGVDAQAGMMQAMNAMQASTFGINDALAAMASRMGQMAYSGGGGGDGGGNFVWYGDVVVQGSVTTDRQLIDAIHEGLQSKQRRSGALGLA